MRKLFLLFAWPALSSIVLVFFSCKNKKYIHKDDLIGTYKIEQATPFDTTLNPATLIEKYSHCTLSLMEKDNFEFYGIDKATAGFWAFHEKDSIKNLLLFQSGSMPENTIYSQFNKTQLYFNEPIWILDSAFREVIFIRIDK